MVDAGTYEHYKGGRYDVIGLARHSETNELLVVYRSLENGQLWVRPKSMFLESIRGVPRFKKIA